MSARPDMEYAPNVPSLVAAVQDIGCDRVLLVGGDEILGVPGTQVRMASPPGAVLSNGLYVFTWAGSTDAMLVRDGDLPTGPATASWDVADDHPLMKAWSWFGFLWEQARAVGPGPRFNAGDWVSIAGASARDIGRVERSVRQGDTWMYTVVADGRAQRVAESGLLAYDIESDNIAAWLRSEPANASELSVAITVTKLTNPLTDTIYSYLSSKTVFRPYQFRPVLRLLDSPHQRLLIADEVGLGKTIEAGLVWTELEARNPAMRFVLIVCPSALAPKWQAEMRRRFDREVEILDSKGLQRLVDTLRRDDSSARMAAIVSIERLRSSALLADLVATQPEFDLIVVDEAHYLRNRGTLTHDLGQVLTEWADTLIFLSATPLNLGNDDLFNLLNLLVDDEFADSAIFPLQVEPNRFLNATASALLESREDPRSLIPVLRRVDECQLGANVSGRPEFRELLSLLDREALSWADISEAKHLLARLHTLSSVLTRTRKVDVPDAKAVREPIHINVDWTLEEHRAYQAIRDWARSRAEATNAPIGFALQMPLRQAASCLPVARERLLQRDSSLERPLVDDDFDDFELGAVQANTRVDLSDLMMGQSEIAAALRALGDVDTKFDRFLEMLESADEWGGGQVLVFSFFRRTLSYLSERLSDRWRVRVMRGDTPLAERQLIMDDFRAGNVDILLASEVASEGLDFEFCNVVVNYDLPWNPMKVEQRIGRLDRFGQQHDKIFVLNFHVPGTIETDIFERLYRRINVFHESIGELEPILRDELDELSRLALDPRLSDQQRSMRLGQIEVAVEEREKDLASLERNEGLLAGIDQLLIDGFEHDTTSRGRFVGPGELRRLLGEFVRDGTRAKLRSVAGTERVEVIGDEVLADRVTRWGASGAGSRFSATELGRLLRDESPVLLTFDNQDASRSGLDLVSLRHPLVRAAVRHFQQRPFAYMRYGTVVLDASAARPGRWLVVLHLARTTGLQPSLELWPVAIDLDTGNQDDEVGLAVLAGVAQGTLRDGPPPDPNELAAFLERADGLLHERQITEEQRRRAANEALVDARIATQRASFDRKIARVSNTLAEMRLRGRGEAVLRLHGGRITNLEAKRDASIEDLEGRRHLALVTSPVALVQVRAEG